MAEKQKAVAVQEKAAISKRDPWALKRWFAVYAPPYLGGVQLAEVPAADPQKLVGRTLEVTLFDITKDISHLPIKLRFQISRTDGQGAFTRFKGLELARDYMRSLVRRGTSKVAGHFNVSTKDGWLLRVTVVGIAAHRVGTGQRSAMRRRMAEVLLKKAAESDMGQLLKDMLEGVLAAEMFVAAKKVAPMRKVEVAKVKVLRYPAGEEAPAAAVKEAAAAREASS